MDKLTTELDQDFFEGLERRSGNKSNLEQLFGVDLDKDAKQEHSLKYQPIKQTPDSAGATQTARTPDQPQNWRTELAKVANGYKGAESVGKVGIAILQASTTNKTLNAQEAIKLIVYKSKTHVLCTLTLTTNNNEQQQPQRIQQKNGYLQFYDDERLYWSLRFNNESDEQEMLMKLDELAIKIDRQDDLVDKPDLFADCETKPQTQKLSHHQPQQDSDNKEQGKAIPSTKSKLITRISKVGQALPNLTKTEEKRHEDHQEHVKEQQQVKSNNVCTDIDVLITSGLPNKFKNTSSTATLSSTTASDLANLNGYVVEQHLKHMLYTEQRTEHSEIRLNMSKLDYKLDKVLDKIEKLQSKNGIGSGNDEKTKSDKDDELLAMEEKVLDLKKENRRLKQKSETAEKNERVLHIFKHDLQKLGLTTAETTTTTNLEYVLDTLITKTKDLQSELNDTQATCQRLEEQLCAEKLQHNKTDEKLQTLQIEHETLQLDLKQNIKDNAMLEERLGEQHSKLLDNAKNAKKIQSEMANVKIIMNNLYGMLLEKLEPKIDDLPQKQEILAIIGRTIKEVTLASMEQNKN